MKHSIDELGRREFIAHAAKACLGVGLMPMAGNFIHDSVKALTPGARVPTARHVIYLNMAGAMSHLDTFGPKPDAPDIQGPTQSIATSADGVILSEFSICSLSDPPNSRIKCPIGAGEGSSEALTELRSFTKLFRYSCFFASC